MKRIICIVGPSGVGKSTLIRSLIKKHGLIAPTIITSRIKRRDDCGNHLYVTAASFERLIAAKLLLEWDKYLENYYGILTHSFDSALSFSEEGVIIEATPSACWQIKEKFPEAKIIALLPDEINWLRGRLIKRNCQSAEEIERRMADMKSFIEQTYALGGSVIMTRQFSAKEEALRIAEEMIF